ncbi:hypothetical protein NDU88_005799 [Pleurodeles waltl]|uniref:Uncharacterized protein n=1 Tax=Pleurodeles waltl TaxID=8319 RepID=A0AAV7PJM2_PLEWA|nr:hypothetical protein NDU88_005799 [Pleurodeles waltl]
MGRARSPLQDVNTEDGAEARSKRLNRGLQMWLIPGRRCRECGEVPPDQQRTSGRRGDEDRWHGRGALPMGRVHSPLQQDANTEEGTEARGKRLSCGLKLQLNPGRRCRGSAEDPPDQQ